MLSTRTTVLRGLRSGQTAADPSATCSKRANAATVRQQAAIQPRRTVASDAVVPPHGHDRLDRSASTDRGRGRAPGRGVESISARAIQRKHIRLVVRPRGDDPPRGGDSPFMRTVRYTRGWRSEKGVWTYSTFGRNTSQMPFSPFPRTQSHVLRVNSDSDTAL